jgi:hypothetical protein
VLTAFVLGAVIIARSGTPSEYSVRTRLPAPCARTPHATPLRSIGDRCGTAPPE